MTVLVMNGIVLMLVGMILAARALLVGGGEALVEIEGHDSVRAAIGARLHAVLGDAGVPVAAACGGRGTCGQCRVRVSGRVDAPLPTEEALLGDHALTTGLRLACQVTLRGDVRVVMPEGLARIRSLEARVRSARHLTPLLKEIVLDLPPSARWQFRAGAYIQVVCPPFRLRLGDLPTDEAVRADWVRMGIDGLEVGSTSPTTRAYSLANHPAEGAIAMLLVRLALPPPGAPPATPPGVGSSYLFSLRPGEPVAISEPVSHFMARDSDREMVFVAGGAGMAPMRAHILEQLDVSRTTRRISFWYGARSKADILYEEEFDRLQREHANFTWSVALSEPAPDDAWTGPTGFIHQHLRDACLATHPSPAEAEYYICGPPLMAYAVVAVLGEYGVDRSQIFSDDFGG